VIEPLRRVAVLAPHTDDGEFGCGGTVARLVESGAEVTYTAFSSAVRSLPPGFPANTLVREAREATSVLGLAPERVAVLDFDVRTFPTERQRILDAMLAIHAEQRPQLVLMPSVGDIHQDHETVAREALRAFTGATLLGYEIPWNCFGFRQQAYVRIEPRHLDRKVRALDCYRSQRHRNYANETYIRDVARTRGVESGGEFAEVFEVYRWII
jgi:LmbE family N-acetylglucosaminyl deacetylase